MSFHGTPAFSVLPQWETSCRIPALEPETRSDTPVIGTPVPDALLDLLAVQVVLQRLLRQLDHLVISGKAQTDQLILAEVINLRVPLSRSQTLQPQPLLQPDDTVLHFKRVLAKLEKSNERDDRNNQQPGGRYAPVMDLVEDSEDQVGNQEEEKNKVKRRIEPGMILEILRFQTYSCVAMISFRPKLAAPAGGVSAGPFAAALGACIPALPGFCAVWPELSMPSDSPAPESPDDWG